MQKSVVVGVALFLFDASNWTVAADPSATTSRKAAPVAYTSFRV